MVSPGAQPRTRTLYPAPILDLARVEAWMGERGLRETHARTLYRGLFGKFSQGIPNEEWTEATLPAELPQRIKTDLVRDFTMSSSRVVEQVASEGGFKLVVELQDKQRVETVVIRHHHESAQKTRYTVCVSSQVGCAKQCNFCATGTMGLRADLSAGEIAEQVWHASEALRQSGGGRVRNVVYMGMGEPLANYREVMLSLRTLTHRSLFAIADRHVTVSTVGDAPTQIRRLADHAPRVRLAVSLHSANQATRHSIMPATVREDASLLELAAAMDYHTSRTGLVPMIEYLQIKGVNDTPEEAAALAAFVNARCSSPAPSDAPAAQEGEAGGVGGEGAERRRCLLNLIPYNPTGAGAVMGYLSPSRDEVETFRSALASLGVSSLVRWTSASGRDADGACGQLVVDTRRPADIPS